MAGEIQLVRSLRAGAWALAVAAIFGEGQARESEARGQPHEPAIVGRANQAIPPVRAATRGAQATERSDESRSEITFSGYQRFTDGSSRFFVRMSHRPAIKQRSEGTQMTFTLLNSFVGLRNNKHPLDFSHFESPLVRAQLVPRGSNVDLVMQFRKPANELGLAHRFAQRGDGTFSLQIDLPRY